MAEPRTVEDRLRSEYAYLLPAMQRTRTEVETEVQHLLLRATLSLDQYERIVVRSRLKDCESAVDALRRREKFGLFDADHPEQYSLTSLPDLVGVRVLTFPQRRLKEVHETLFPRIGGWVVDHIEPIVFKYTRRWNAGDLVKSEIQVLSLLIGLFWEAEHSAIYKPSPSLRGVAPRMKDASTAVIAALQEFESEFGRLIDEATDSLPPDKP
jgi:hypothetical protein